MVASPFGVRRSAFGVRRSAFGGVRRSPFAVRRSPFTVHRSTFTGRWSSFIVSAAVHQRSSSRRYLLFADTPTRRHADTFLPPSAERRTLLKLGADFG
jgi:hypothetical protein